MTNTGKPSLGLTGLAGIQAKAQAGVVDEVAEALANDGLAQPTEPTLVTEAVEPPAPPTIDPLLAEAEPRRVHVDTKVVREIDQTSPAERAKKLAVLNTDRAQQARFLSRYPDLVVYVDFGGRKDTQIKFRNGAFNTSDAGLAEALRAHPRCNTVLFREETDANTVALRQEAARQRAALRSPSYAGATTSYDGNEALFNKHDGELAAVEHAAIDFGGNK